jgi:hypothetical protein
MGRMTAPIAPKWWENAKRRSVCRELRELLTCEWVGWNCDCVRRRQQQAV